MTLSFTLTCRFIPALSGGDHMHCLETILKRDGLDSLLGYQKGRFEDKPFRCVYVPPHFIQLQLNQNMNEADKDEIKDN
jgi:hypothetical protein